MIPLLSLLIMLLLQSRIGITVAVKLLDPVEIKGFKFFAANQEIVIRGIDYFPRPNAGDLNHNSEDLFTDEHRHIWERDVPYLQELGVNAIRLYAVDPKKNHDSFMCAMNAAGIYVIVELAHDCATCAITRDAAPECYPPQLKNQGQQVINEFAKYPNTLAFSAGNEVNHFAPVGMPQWNAPCQKKFLRDMREYMDSCKDSLRRVPIGLVSADDQRQEMATYYNCRTNPQDKYENAEWYGLNAYVFCDGKAETYQDALGYQLLTTDFESYNYSIPVLLTEFGCLSETFPTINGFQGQRNFLQASWMLNEPQVRNQFAGGFAFEYSIEKENAQAPWPFQQFGYQNYGVGYFGPESCDDLTVPCAYHPLPSYDALKRAYTSTSSAEALKQNDFEIPQGRMGLSECPSDYPALNDFVWLADTVQDEKCPPPARFTCPSTLLDIGGKEKEFSEKTIFLVVCATLVVLILGVVACVLVVLVCLQRKNNKHQELVNLIKPNKVPSWLTFHSSKHGVGIDDSASQQSSESGGLLSMQHYNSTKTDYHALDSDESTDDLEAEGR